MVRRSAFPQRAHDTAAADLRAERHEAISRRLQTVTIETPDDVGRPWQPAGTEPRRRVPDRPRGAVGPADARLERGRHRLAGPRLGPGPARHRLRRREDLHRRQRRAVRVLAGLSPHRVLAQSLSQALPRNGAFTGGLCSSPRPATTASSASTSTGRNSTGRCTSQRRTTGSGRVYRAAGDGGPLMLNKLHINNVLVRRERHVHRGTAHRRDAALQRRNRY